jgi:hypothetical protein
MLLHLGDGSGNLAEGGGTDDGDLAARSEWGEDTAVGLDLLFLQAFDLHGEVAALSDGAVGDRGRWEDGAAVPCESFHRNREAGVPLRSSRDDAKVDAHPDKVFGRGGNLAELEVAERFVGIDPFAQEEDGEDTKGGLREVALDGEDLTAGPLLLQRLTG